MSIFQFTSIKITIAEWWQWANKSIKIDVSVNKTILNIQYNNKKINEKQKTIQTEWPSQVSVSLPKQSY